MSAFVCSDKHINTIVSFASKQRVYVSFLNSYVEFNEQEVATELLNENVKSVNYRYEENKTQEIIFELQKPVKPVDVLKLCQSLGYQSCEHPEWESSKAKRVLDSITDKAISLLPGYEEAEWSI